MAHLPDDAEKNANQQTDFPLLKDDRVEGVAPDAGFPDIDAEPGVSSKRGDTPHSKQEPTESPRPSQGESLPHAASRVSLLVEPPETPVLVPEQTLRMQTRRDFLIYGAGVAAAAAGFWWMLPEDTKGRLVSARSLSRWDSLEARTGLASRRTTFLGRVLDFDDDVAEALYSPDRMVPTYRKADITPNLRNNYDGQTPDPDYIPDWTLELTGLASGGVRNLTIHDLLRRFTRHDQITRLVCVEGWSAIAWWGGLRFGDLLAAYPPAPGMRWARLESSVNLDSDGNSDPYYVSIDLDTARHPQSLLATHQNGAPLDVDHGAPLRLIVPMKLGLKNIKAVTAIRYTAAEPPDYWNQQGYSKYDGI
ncbi:MAG: molybdopterin-dependent oxidoreductase [Capsulimonadaceae bacterium]